MNNVQIVLAERPEGLPNQNTFRFEDTEMNSPTQGEVLIESVYISVDPYMRGRMSDAESYVEPYALDQPIGGHVVGVIIESNSDKFEKGDVVTGQMEWKKYNTLSAKQLIKVRDKSVPAYLYLSTLGMPGQTAYQGLMQIGKPQKGETVVVSAASGAVGSVVGQIAKIQGARVVGIAGGQEKTAYLKDTLKFDEAVDYKSDNYPEQLKQALPAGVDVYFENVGGKVSDEVFKHLNKFARIPVCGSISSYNHPEEDVGPRIQTTLTKKQALMQGFIVGQFAQYFREGTKQLIQWVNEGKIISKTTVDEGFENIPSAFSKLFTGDNFGKQVVKVSDALDE